MKYFLYICLIVVCLGCDRGTGALPLLSVSENGRFLVRAGGEAFFWLGDTAWLICSRLDREEARHYLDDRAQKGFNVVQLMLLHSLDAVNVYGDSALVGRNVALPNVSEGSSPDDPGAYDYWDHVDHIADLAAERGIYLAMVPVWGSNVRGGGIPAGQAAEYAGWLARRFGSRTNIIWLNGGDTRGDENVEVWDAIGEELKRHAPDQLLSFHPYGRCASSMWFHQRSWLDLNMFQSGHRRYDQDDTQLAYGEDNWRYVLDDYALSPAKPTLDGEPSYEGIPQGLHDSTQPYWTAAHVRRYAYWSVFSGACGFTYGHSAVMQMHKAGDASPAYGVRETWSEALQADGACQMRHLKELIESRSFSDRVPDTSWVIRQAGRPQDYQAVTLGDRDAMIYTWSGREILLGSAGPACGAAATWFNPRTGESSPALPAAGRDTLRFDPPGEVEDGNDWVLVLDYK